MAPRSAVLARRRWARCCRRRGAASRRPPASSSRSLLLAGLLLGLGGRPRLRLPSWRRQVDEALARRATAAGSTALGFGVQLGARRRHHRHQRHRLRHRAALRPVRQPAGRAGAGRRCSGWSAPCPCSAWPGSHDRAAPAPPVPTGWSAGHRAPTGWRGRALAAAAAALVVAGGGPSEGADALVSQVRARGALTRPRLGHADLPPRRRTAPGEVTHPVLHACTRAAAGRARRLRRRRGRGARAARTCSSRWSSSAPSVADQGLFEPQGMPRLAPLAVRPGPAPARRTRPQRRAALLHRGRPGLLPVRRPGQPRTPDGAGAPGRAGGRRRSPSPTGPRCWREERCRERARASSRPTAAAERAARRARRPAPGPVSAGAASWPGRRSSARRSPSTRRATC